MNSEASKREGFTLLEVAVAIAILSIVLVAVLRMQGQTIGMNEAFRFYTLAPQLAAAKMNEMRLDPGGYSSMERGDFGEDLDGFSWEAGLEDVTLTTDQDREMIFKRVDISVHYMENEFTYTARQYIQAPTEDL